MNDTDDLARIEYIQRGMAELRVSSALVHYLHAVYSFLAELGLVLWPNTGI